MPGNQVVQLIHWHASPRAAGVSLPGPDRTGVVTVSVTLAGSERHRARTCGTEADAGEQGRPADHTRRRDLGIARS